MRSVRGSETAEANGPGYEGAAHEKQGSILAEGGGICRGWIELAGAGPSRRPDGVSSLKGLASFREHSPHLRAGLISGVAEATVATSIICHAKHNPFLPV